MSDAPGSPGEGGAAEPERPVLRVVRGTPTDEELAALLAVVAARGAPAPADGRRTRSAWAEPSRAHRAPLAHGSGAWRRSASPR